jgi:molybdenum-dependent DNA-binding transcriptional regulator ModE
MRLEVFDLELVLQIAKTGSLTQAAQQAAISLQAASERLKKSNNSSKSNCLADTAQECN